MIFGLLLFFSFFSNFNVCLMIAEILNDTIRINKISIILIILMTKLITPNAVFKGFEYKLTIEKKQNFKNICWLNTITIYYMRIFIKNLILHNKFYNFIYLVYLFLSLKGS